MWNIFSGNCCACEAPLSFKTPWNVDVDASVRVCDWCHSFWDDLSKSNTIINKYFARDYTPLDYYAEKNDTKDNYRNTFTAGMLTRETPKVINVLSRMQNSPEVKDIGGYFYKDVGPRVTAILGKKVFRHDFAVLPEWNTMQSNIVFAVPPGIEMIVGTAAACKIYLGGGKQVYVHPYVAQLLYPASCKFLQNPNPKSYKEFLHDSKPAIEMQECLNAEYKIHLALFNDDVHDHNVLVEAHKICTKIRALHEKAGELAPVFLELEDFIQKTKLKNPTKNGDKKTNEGNMSWNEMQQFVPEQRIHLNQVFTTLPFKTIEAGAQWDKAVKNPTSGNNVKNLNAAQLERLKKVQRLCRNSEMQEYNSQTMIECGTILVHATEYITVEIIITFKGMERRGNTTIYKYEVVTLTTYYR